MNEASMQYAMADTVDNTLKLAQAHIDKSQYLEAKNLYLKALSGVYEDEPDIRLGLANTHYLLQEYAESLSAIQNIMEKSPNYNNSDMPLLFAKNLEQLNQLEQAKEQYASLSNYYPGAEAKVRYALLLQKLGESEKANSIFAEIIQLSKNSGKHYRTINKEWIAIAKKAGAI